MWWKIYYWLSLISTVFYIISLFNVQVALIDLLFLGNFIIAIVGLHAYIYKKNIFSKEFWRFYFWLTVTIDVMFFLYSFAPDDPIIHNLSFIKGSGETSKAVGLIGTLLDFPLLFALYQLGFSKSKKNK